MKSHDLLFGGFELEFRVGGRGAGQEQSPHIPNQATEASAAAWRSRASASPPGWNRMRSPMAEMSGDIAMYWASWNFAWGDQAGLRTCCLAVGP